MIYAIITTVVLVTMPKWLNVSFVFISQYHRKLHKEFSLHFDVMFLLHTHTYTHQIFIMLKKKEKYFSTNSIPFSEMKATVLEIIN